MSVAKPLAVLALVFCSFTPLAQARDACTDQLARTTLTGPDTAIRPLLTRACVRGLTPTERDDVMSTLILRGSAVLVGRAIDAGMNPDQIIAVDRAGETAHVRALTLAFGAPNAQSVLQMLIAKGANVHAAGIHDDAPLVLAAAHGQIAVMKSLLERGARPDTGDRLVGATPLMLLAAARIDDSDALAGAKLLALHRVDLNATTSTGHTALMIAAQRGRDPLVAWLLAQGADPARRDARGMSAVELARQGGHESTARLLGQRQ